MLAWRVFAGDTSSMSKSRIAVILLLGLALLGVVLLRGHTRRERPPAGPARQGTTPSWSTFDSLPPKWDGVDTPPVPPYDWPEAFRLPPHPEIIIDDVPEIPEAIREPSPPIEDE